MSAGIIGNDSAEMRKVEKYYNNYISAFKNNRKNGEEKKKDKWLTVSRVYSEAMFLKERCAAEFAVGKLNPDYFAELYQRINQNYHGQLREKIIVTSFLRLFENYSDASKYLPAAVSDMQNTHFKKMLRKMMLANMPGSMAYKFSLEDEQGRLVSLDDFGNKVLVIDFWYTGCIGCANLNKLMQPLIDSLSGRDDLVFLSINVDCNRELGRRVWQQRFIRMRRASICLQTEWGSNIRLLHITATPGSRLF